MTTQQVPKGTERVVSALVKDRADKYDGDGNEITELSLEAGFFQSQYPTIVTLSREDAGNIKPGVAVNVVLRCGNLKKQKNGQPQSGDKPFHYYWDFVRWADGAETPATAPQRPAEPQRGPSAPVAGALDGMRFGNALNNAAQLAVAYPELNAQQLYDMVLPLAARFYTVTAADIQAATETPAEGQGSE